MSTLFKRLKARVDFLVQYKQVAYSIILMVTIPLFLAAASYFVYRRASGVVDGATIERARVAGYLVETNIRSSFKDRQAVSALINPEETTSRERLQQTIESLQKSHGRSFNDVANLHVSQRNRFANFALLKDITIYVPVKTAAREEPVSVVNETPATLSGINFRMVSSLSQKKSIGTLLNAETADNKLLYGYLTQALTADQIYTLPQLYRNEQGTFEEPAWSVLISILDATGQRVAIAEVVTSNWSMEDRLSRDVLFPSVALVGALAAVVLLLIMGNSRLFEYAVLYRRMKEVDQMKDEFISVASHELRTPLTSIRGFLSLLNEDFRSALPPKVQKIVAQADDSAAQLATLVNDLLDVSRIEQNRIQLQRVPVDLTLFLKKITAQYLPTAKAKGLALTVTADKGVGTVMADEERLKQVMTNLVGNAIKYTEEGGVELRLSLADHRARIDVKDTGLGIPPQDLKSIFKKFFRVKNEKTEEIPGTGLGLWITKALVERMGGTIVVESIERVGSQFTVFLPLEEPQA